MSSHHHDDHDEMHDHDRGLSHDLPRLVSSRSHSDRVETILGRRRLLAAFGGVGAAAAVAGCGSASPSSSSPTSSSGAGRGDGPPSNQTDVNVADGEIPEETAGPYPSDGSNGPDVLSRSGIVRSDITSSFGDSSGVAEGVPLTIRLKVYDANGDDMTPYAGAAVYLWHCNRDGEYSMYGQDVADENYLRGVQAADANGAVEFTSIFPAAYDGRWPHIHFEVYPTVDDATSASNRLRTSQLALPEAACKEVYATDGYQASVANLAQTSLSTDMVFSDGWSLQLAKTAGSVSDGYVASLNVPV